MEGIGRPTLYNEDIASEICGRLVAGEPLVRMCRDEHLPDVRTVYRWLVANETFRHMYEAARQDQADTLADEIVQISDDGTNDFMEAEDSDGKVYWKLNGENIQRSRLRVDARKWVAAKLKPRKYGDKTETVLSNPDGSGVLQGVTINLVKPT